MKLDLQRFAGAPFDLTLSYDSTVTNVVDNYGNSWTNSVSKSITAGVTRIFTLTLKEGYVIDSVTSDSTYSAITNITDNSFEFLQENEFDNPIVTITTKQSGGSSMKSVDLTTLSGWNELSDGTHNITIVAKGTGYSDSEESDSVQVTKSSGETWVLNSALTMTSTSFNYKINFTSNGQNYDSFIRYYDNLDDADYLRYSLNNNAIYAYNHTWQNQAYRTITFDTAPTGALLTWLQANGTKQ